MSSSPTSCRAAAVSFYRTSTNRRQPIRTGHCQIDSGSSGKKIIKSIFITEIFIYVTV